LLDDYDVEDDETVTLALANPGGGAELGSPSSAVLTITNDDTENRPPAASLAYDSDTVYQVGGSVPFDGSTSSDPNGDPLSYGWDFGDGATGIGETVSHSYDAAGDYTVTLTVSDGEYEDTQSTTVTIYPEGELHTITLRQGADGYEGCGDAHIVRLSEGNYGATEILYVYNGDAVPEYRPLIRFDTSSLPLPDGAVFASGRLELNCTEAQAGAVNEVHAVTHSWVEGSGTWGDTHDGATWNTWNGEDGWSAEGGDYDRSTDYGLGANGVVDSASIEEGTVNFDISPLVEDWLADPQQNYGVIITMPETISYTRVTYDSRESSGGANRPALAITYIIPSQSPTPTPTPPPADFPVRINFQPPGSAAPAGFEADGGGAYADHGARSFGWK
jgi:PKD repeat protein